MIKFLKSLLKQTLTLTFIFGAPLYISSQSNQTAYRNLRAVAVETALAPSYLPNPVKSNPSGDCRPENLRPNLFSPKYDRADRAKLCSLLENLRLKLWQSRSKVGELDFQLAEIWKVTPYLYFEKVGWTQNVFGGVFGHATYRQIFQPDGTTFKRGVMALRLKEKTFPYTFLHELRHVRDLYDGYNGGKVYSARQLEESAFLIESYYTEATEERAAFFKEFWRSEWRAVSRPERRRRALDEIARYMLKYY